MNEQPDNKFDQRIRQALDRLPDVPAPNTAFNAGKLWEQMRPELVAQPVLVPKHRTYLRWLVAASLSGLLLAGLWWSWKPSMKPLVVDRQPVEKRAGRYELPKNVVTPTEHITHKGKSAKQVDATGNRMADRKAVERTGSVPDVAQEAVAAPEPETLANVQNPEPEPTQTLPITAGQPTSPVTVATPKAIAPKRRFRVVHENELKAEEEAIYSQIRTKSSSERFVRIGTGNQVSTGSDEPSPAILLPLNRKSTQ
jgi:hypothetical protein